MIFLLLKNSKWSLLIPVNKCFFSTVIRLMLIYIHEIYEIISIYIIKYVVNFFIMNKIADLILDYISNVPLCSN